MADVGNLYVIAAPSGTGKTTLVHALTSTLPDITVSISYTTREKRPNEVDGINYHFVDKAEFERMIAHHDFLEYATVFDQYYGTSKTWVEDTLAKGIDVILEIDWQGHQQIKKLFPDSNSIFILPPSLEHLRDRLVKRNQDHPDIIQKRLADARETASHIREFNYLVINDMFSTALHELKIIIETGRLLRHRQLAKHQQLIKNLSTMAV
ncbi:MAG: guanylate kinase [Gammaproteobacteria bacterium]